MADIVEALHILARQRGRGETSPLLVLRSVAEREGARISHLPISQRLAQAWVVLTGQPFRQHQSLALAALRRGEPFGLVGGGQAARQTAHLLAYELLRGEPQATALLLAPDDSQIDLHLGELERLNVALGAPVSAAAARGDGVRAAFAARIVVASPTVLHDRLLRHHDRAWRGFWSRLRLILIADAHQYDGVAAAHLSALLLRSQRLAPAGTVPLLGATLAVTRGADEVLAQVGGQPWRLIALDDVPHPQTSLALWRSGSDRAREIVALALGFQRADASVHVVCAPFEVLPLRALIGADLAAVSVGSGVLPAQVQILAGAACGAAALREAMDSGAQLVLLLLGDEPSERTIARLAARDPEHLPLLDDPPPALVAAATNAYVVAQHLVCAASESPLTAEEVAAWQVGSIVARLEEHHQLARLPENAVAWQPLPSGGDPYLGFDLHAVGGAPATLLDEQGTYLAGFDPVAFDRWGFLGAALPPLRGGYRVVGRDEDELALTIRAAGEGRRTFPLRRCVVRVRDRREARSLRGRDLAWGRVVVDEEIYGYREVSVGSAPVERALNPVLTASWSAPAVWIDLPMAVGVAGQLVGWSLAAAMATHSLLVLADCVPAYDAEARRIYFVDAQPGGNGLAAWVYTNLEELLPLAYDIALDCRGDPLVEPLARADMDWLLALLGGSLAPVAVRVPSEVATERGQAAGRAAPVGPGHEAGRPAVQRVPDPPVRSEPPVRAQPPRAEPVRSEPPARTEPLRSDPPVRAEPSRAEPVRIEPPARTETPRSDPPARVEPVRAEPPLRTPPAGPDPKQNPLPSTSTDRTKIRRSSESRPGEARPSSGRNTTEARYKGRSEPPARGRTVEPAPPPAGRAKPPPASRAEPPARGRTVPPVPPPPVAEPLPDAAAMVARLRRLREQREQREPKKARPRQKQGNSTTEPRFQIGDKIFCMPWGYGEVRASSVVDDQEQLVVSFADHGELAVDPAVSAVRLVQAEDEAGDPDADES